MFLQPELSQFLPMLVFIVGAIVFCLVGLMAARFLRPHKPNPEKLKPYESGEEPVGDAWGNFSVRFYIVALVFLLFDVELLFLFPWARVFTQPQLMLLSHNRWGWYMFYEVLFFVALLALGLAWAWLKGYLDWIKPQPVVPKVHSPVPEQMYQEFNKRILKKPLA
jgi:NADH-quinone oxidoreductase subunit A